MKKSNKMLKKIVQTPLGKSFILNLIYMGGMLLFFEPFLSIDDYVMSEYGYGVFSDDYDYCVRYENFIYGRLITSLMKLFPDIPWYTVLFYIWIFISLTLFAYIVLIYFDNYLGIVVANTMLLFFSYEGYVCIQFTKVSGIIGAIGFFALMAPRICWKAKGGGIFLFLMSCLIRYDTARMIVGAWVCALIIKLFWELLFHKSIKKNKKALRCILIGIVIYLIVPYIPQYSSLQEEEFWQLYWDYNSYRSSVQDYGYPPYHENVAAYDALGISENDLYIWYSWNADSDGLTLEKGAGIVELKTGKAADEEKTLTDFAGEFFSRYLNIGKICSFFKQFPKEFLTMDVYWAFLILMILFFLCIDKTKPIKSAMLSGYVASWAVLMALNYYLFVNKRYLQHRVDVSIILVVCTILIFMVVQEERIFVLETKKSAVLGLYLCLLLCVPYQYYGDDRETVSEDLIATNRLFFEQIGNDSDACYYFAANRSDGSTPLRVFYRAFEVPKVGISKNCFYSNTIYDQKRMEEYGIDRIFVDMVDSDFICLVMSETDTNQSAWEEYLSDYCGTEVKLFLVKDYMGKKIYRALSEPVTEFLKIGELKGAGDIVSDMSFSISENNKFEMEGTAYLRGTSGFSQNSYLQVVDSRTKKYELFLTCQTCDEEKAYGQEGYFAQISASMQLPEFYDEGDIINLLIEENGVFYSVNLQ